MRLLGGGVVCPYRVLILTVYNRHLIHQTFLDARIDAISHFVNRHDFASLNSPIVNFYIHMIPVGINPFHIPSSGWKNRLQNFINSINLVPVRRTDNE